jgi:putative transposase
VARKKALSLPLTTRRSWVESNPDYSVRRQCRLAGISRSGFYYEPVPETEENIILKQLIDEQYRKHPEFGYPRMTDFLRTKKHNVSYKRGARLMREMGLQAITPGPHTSKPAPGNKIYPYLLRNVAIERVNQVWSTDITYIPMGNGYMYLAAVIDWLAVWKGWQKINEEAGFAAALLGGITGVDGIPEKMDLREEAHREKIQELKLI